MSKKQDQIPIDITHPKEFLGHEFYLVIARDNLFEDIRTHLTTNAEILKKVKWAIQDLVDKAYGKKKVDFTDFDGAIIEITERQPRYIKGYAWPSFNRATFEDGTRIATTIHPDEGFRNYLFVPTRAQSTNGNEYEMVGTMKSYDLHDNLVGELEQKVTLQYQKIPECKSRGGNIICF